MHDIKNKILVKYKKNSNGFRSGRIATQKSRTCNGRVPRRRILIIKKLLRYVPLFPIVSASMAVVVVDINMVKRNAAYSHSRTHMRSAEKM